MFPDRGCGTTRRAFVKPEAKSESESLLPDVWSPKSGRQAGSARTRYEGPAAFPGAAEAGAVRRPAQA